MEKIFGYIILFLLAAGAITFLIAGYHATIEMKKKDEED